MSLRVGSLFSGIGGLDLGLERAGMTVAWQSEIDPSACRELNHHWPEVPNHGDITAINPDALGPVDVLTGGFPCQDLSVAGRRAGLAGEQSRLWFEFERIARILRPRWLVIENVPGLLSSKKGADFQYIIETLAELGYGVAWRVLDSRYFGVPQRRRRLFIVGCLGSPAGAFEVLFEPESSPWDTPPSREAGQVFATLLASGAGTSRPAGIAGEADYLLVDVNGVRRPTPRECERLQGFPDGWTCLCDAHGDTTRCTCPDNPRYRALGNAVTVPVAEWIGRRILAVEATMTKSEEGIYAEVQ